MEKPEKTPENGNITQWFVLFAVFFHRDYVKINRTFSLNIFLDMLKLYKYSFVL